MKKNHLLASLCGLVLSSMTGHALANSGNGIYILGSIGVTDASMSDVKSENDSFIIPTSSKVSSSDRAYKVGMGYRLATNFAVEMDYVNFGSNRYEASPNSVSVDYSVSGFGVSVLGLLPVSKDIDVFAKVGLHDLKKEAKGGQDGTTYPTVSDNKTVTNLGLGVEYSFNSNISARFELERYSSVGTRKADSAGPIGDINTYSLGLVGKF